MSALQIITRGRTPARSAHAAELFLVACLAAASGGCQWILDDIGDASDAEMASEAGDASTDEEGGRARGDGAAPTAKDGGAIDDPSSMSGSDGSAHQGGASTDAAQGAGSDAAVGGSDTGAATGVHDAGVRDAATPLDGSGPAPDVGNCSEPVSWYADDDEDGYGRSSAMLSACPAPAGSWSQSAGDCNDDDPRVHPDQPDFFDEPYQAPDGSASFDYDCSGREEGNGMQTAFSGSCGLLDNLVCVGGSGYEATARSGAQNALCGSRDFTACEGGLLGTLVCQPRTVMVAERYRCR